MALWRHCTACGRYHVSSEHLCPALQQEMDTVQAIADAEAAKSERKAAQRWAWESELRDAAASGAAYWRLEQALEVLRKTERH